MPIRKGLCKANASCAAIPSFVRFEKAPMACENINENNEKYWAEVDKEEQNYICLFGLVIPPTAKDRFSGEILDQAFYQHPEEDPSMLQSHTHAAFLETGPEKWPHNMNEFFKSLQNLQVKSVRHLLTHSLLQEATFAIFPLTDIRLLDKKKA